MTLSAKNIFVLAVLLFPIAVLAQPGKIKFRDRLGDSTIVVNTAVVPPKVKGPKALSREWSGGVRLNSDGYSLFINRGTLLSDGFGQRNEDRFYHVRFFTFEISEKKHPKETRSNGGTPGVLFQPGSYILGKVNNFYQLKLGYGRRHMIAGKPDPGTVAIHWAYQGGFAAGLVKPYYINHIHLGEIKYSDSIASDFVGANNILGKGGFAKGLNEVSFVPGVFVRTGLHFDFATKRKGVLGAEFGINGEIYTRKIDLMVAQQPQLYFLNFYAAFQIGKRS